jgi:transcriptional regulator with XRE-family HTH domain
MIENKSNIESEESMGLFDLDNELPLESQIYIRHSLDIPRYVKTILADAKMSQSQLADKLGKSEAEISKWLSGRHNATLRTISKLEAALSLSIINPLIKIDRKLETRSYNEPIKNNPKTSTAPFIQSKTEAPPFLYPIMGGAGLSSKRVYNG